MSGQVRETVRIVSANPRTGWALIARENFDPAKHTLWTQAEPETSAEAQGDANANVEASRRRGRRPKVRG